MLTSRFDRNPFAFISPSVRVSARWSIHFSLSLRTFVAKHQLIQLILTIQMWSWTSRVSPSKGFSFHSMSPSSLSGSSFWLTLLHRYVSVPYFWNMRASCYWDQVTIKFDLFESPAKILWIWINNSIDDGCAASTTSFDQFRSPLGWPVPM